MQLSATNQALLDQALTVAGQAALARANEWLELGRREGVHDPRLRHDEQEHLRAGQSRQLVRLKNKTNAENQTTTRQRVKAKAAGVSVTGPARRCAASRGCGHAPARRAGRATGTPWGLPSS